MDLLVEVSEGGSQCCCHVFNLALAAATADPAQAVIFVAFVDHVCDQDGCVLGVLDDLFGLPP